MIKMGSKSKLIIVMALFLITLNLQNTLQERQTKQGFKIATKHYPIVTYPVKTLLKQTQNYEQISFPVSHIFQLELSCKKQLQSIKRLIKYHPTSLKLQSLKKSLVFALSQRLKPIGSSIAFQQQLIKSQKFSLLAQLRTPFRSNERKIVILNQIQQIVFEYPNKLTFIQESEHIFSVKNTLIMHQLTLKHKDITNLNIKLFQLFQNYIILFCYNTRQLFLIHNNTYDLIENSVNITHLQHLILFLNQTSTLQFLTAEGLKGINHYRIDLYHKTIQLVRRIDLSQTKTSLSELILNIKDITLQKTLSINNANLKVNKIYVLDKNIGLFSFIYYPQQTNQSKVTQNHKLLINQRACKAMDIIQNDRIILICEQQRKGLNFFIEAFMTRQGEIQQILQPVFHSCSFQDLIITDQVYIAFQQQSIDVFWSKRNHYVPQMVHNKRHINLIGLQAFKVKMVGSQIFVYSIRNNMYRKEKLTQQQYRVQVGSKLTVNQVFTLTTYGNCLELINQNNNEQSQFYKKITQEKIDELKNYLQSKQSSIHQRICQINQPIYLQASTYIVENRQQFSLAAGFFIVSVLLSFVLICICIMKYKGMQQEVRKALYKVKNGQLTSPTKFLL